VQSLARRSRDLRVRILGRSQEGRDIPLLVFARPAAADGAEVLKNGKPTVLIIGLQHGNEPAGGEAALALAGQLASGDRAAVLDRLNVLIVPRGNPDGAYHFVRGLHDGNDVNRDHLLQLTPEGQALGRVATEFQPDVVLDCHEFGVKTRWLEKFGALQGYDALIQYATVSNLPALVVQVSERMFRQPLVRALDAAELRHSWYYTSSYNMTDPVVSMGGVVPDTGRNIGGLRNAVSFLIETRGVGIGRAHFKRRVYTHLVAMNAFLDAAAQNGDVLLSQLRAVRRQVAGEAGQGDIIISGVATPTRHTLQMIDPETGNDKQVEVAWRDALELQVRLQRPRPYGYVLAAGETKAARHLRQLGVTVMRVVADERIDVQRYRITSREEAKKEDVRSNDEDATPRVIRITTVTEPAQLLVHVGDFYVPMDQPLANVVSAALEPETQSSFASNRLLSLPAFSGEPLLRLYRLSVPLDAPVLARDWE
jgi:Zinc carboxypeptidase